MSYMPACRERLGPTVSTPYSFMCSEALPQRHGDTSIEDAYRVLGTRAAGSPFSPLPFWAPEYIANAAITAQLPDAERIRVVNDATVMALGFYAGHPNPPLLKDVVARLRSYGVQGGEMPCNVNFFLKRWRETSTEAAGRIYHDGIKNGLFMPVARSGTMLGMFAFLHHQTYPHTHESVMYPVAYSVYKSRHRVPQITDTELDYISELSRERAIVLYDNDASRGTTISGLVRYLKQRLPKDRRIVGYVNEDYRKPLTIKRQGQHWERVTVPAVPQAPASV